MSPENAERQSKLSECRGPELLEISTESQEISPLLLDQSSLSPTPLPKLQVAVLMLVLLPEGVTSTLINPFIVEFIRRLHIVKDGPGASAGYYSGRIDSCFFVTQAIFMFFWARASDKVGRKPIILIGSLGVSIAMLCFGLSTSLFGIMASRALQGALNGNLGIVRTMLSEVTDPSNRAQAFAFAPVIWATGSTLGPLIGGMLANPAGRFPIFKTWFWHSHPYLLPCMATAALSLTAFLFTAVCIKENTSDAAGLISRITSAKPTSPPARPVTRTAYGAVDVAELEAGVKIKSPLAALFTPRLTSVLVNHALLALLDNSFTALEVIFLATPIKSGGLGLAPSQIGVILGVTAFVHGALQITCFAPLYRISNPKHLYTACVTAITLAYACFPVINALALAGGLVQPRLWVLLVFQMLLVFATYLAFSVMLIFVSNAAPAPAMLGTTNGVAATIFSCMGAVGPASVTSLFAISVERNLLGGNLVYIAMCSIAAIAVLASIFFLPERPGEVAMLETELTQGV